MQDDWRRRLGRASVFETETVLPLSPAKVFDFFSRAENLERLTPPSLRFRILTPLPIDMRVGARIAYRIRIHGFPVRWDTEILEWDPPRGFVDLQRRGPYRLWHHRHAFRAVEGGTAMTDTVHYLSPLHRLVNPLYIRREVARIFAFRERALADALDLPEKRESAWIEAESHRLDSSTGCCGKLSETP